MSRVIFFFPPVRRFFSFCFLLFFLCLLCIRSLAASVAIASIRTLFERFSLACKLGVLHFQQQVLPPDYLLTSAPLSWMGVGPGLSSQSLRTRRLELGC